MSDFKAKMHQNPSSGRREGERKGEGSVVEYKKSLKQTVLDSSVSRTVQLQLTVNSSSLHHFELDAKCYDMNMNVFYTMQMWVLPSFIKLFCCYCKMNS